jgi:glutaredoxin
VKKYNPHRSFPTIVVDEGKHVIIGFDEKEIRKTVH